MTLQELDNKIVDSEKRLAKLQQEEAQLARDIAVAKTFRDAYPRLMGVQIPEATPIRMPVQTPLIARADLAGYGAKTKAIRKAIEDCGREYTVYDVEKKLGDRGVNINRLAISQALSSLAQSGEIFVRDKGAGRKATTYTKEPLTT